MFDIVAAQAYVKAYADLRVDVVEIERHVRLFRNGRNQAIRIPRDFELEGDEAIIKRDGDRLIIEPVRKGKLLAILQTLETLEEAFPNVDEELGQLDDVDL